MPTASRPTLALAALLFWTAAANAAPPAYSIIDLGVATPADAASQAVRISPGGVATGRSLGTIYQACTWTAGGAIQPLPVLASPARDYCVANGANDAGEVVGTGTTTPLGASPLPLLWQGGVVSQIPLPTGQVVGRANDINDAHVAVGSVGSGNSEIAFLSTAGASTVITTLTPNGCYMRTAFGINDAGVIAGIGVDPVDAARNVAMLYDITTSTAVDLGGLPGMNGGICFDISESGAVCGASMQGQGNGTPFVWSAETGMQAIPLPPATSNGSGRGVLSPQIVVGNAGGQYSVPWLYYNGTTYRIQDLIPPDSGWDLSTNTAASAMSIAPGGVIVGTGVHDGQFRAYMMIPDQPLAAPPATVSATLVLAAPSPNPTRGATSLSFSMPHAAYVRLEVLDVRGRVVRVLFDGMAAAGRLTRAWDGQSEGGAPAPPGVYFVRLRTPGQALARRLSLVR